MKNKLEIYILLGIIAVLSLYIILREDQNINYKIPKISLVKEDEITKIIFDKMELTTTDNIWYLPSGYKVAKNSINRIISELSGLRVIDKISDTEDYDRFSLGDPKVLQVFKNDKLVTNILIGSTSSTGNYTYIKFPDDKSVYSIRGDIKELFGEGETELRSKTILTATDIQEVIINNKDGEVVKTGEDLKDLQFLTSIEADSFKVLPRDETLLTLTIKVGESYKSVIIYNKVENEYPATSSEVNFPFTLSENLVNKISDIK